MSAGQFIWHELLARDVVGAKRFYAQLFGWKAHTHDVGELGSYDIFAEGDRQVAGIVPLKRRWVPSNWTPFVAVDHIGRAAKNAVFFGGNITSGPVKIPGAGEILSIIDDQGAAITLLKPDDPRAFPPARLRVGSFCNHVLNTRDIKQADEFYNRLLGWKLKMVDVGLPKKALVFVHDRVRVATLHRLAEDAPQPNHWLCGIGVKNLPAAHQRAVQLGASSISPPRRAGKLGAMDVLNDPSGAAFCLYEPAPTRR